MRFPSRRLADREMGRANSFVFNRKSSSWQQHPVAVGQPLCGLISESIVLLAES